MAGGARIQLPMISVGPDQGYSMPAAPSMTMSQMPVQSDPKSMLSQHLAGLESKYGLPQGYLAQTRAIESANGTNLANPNSSARGPYQFIDSTAKGIGLSDAGRMDEYQSADAAARLAKQNMDAFQSRFGQSPTGAQLYGMHQQGSAGYMGLMDGRTPGGAAQSLNGAGGMNAQGQLGVIQRMYNNARPDLPGDPTTAYGGGLSGGATQGPGALPAPGAAIPGGTDGGGTVAAGVQGAPGTQSGAAATPDPAKATFNGGIAGLLQGDDYTGAGSGKDFMGKMSDFTGSSAFKSGMSGIAMLLGGGGGGQSGPKAPGIQPMSEADSQNTPNMSLLQMLYGKGGVQSGGVLGR